jgi:hypothetical protein
MSKEDTLPCFCEAISGASLIQGTSFECGLLMRQRARRVDVSFEGRRLSGRGPLALLSIERIGTGVSPVLITF